MIVFEIFCVLFWLIFSAHGSTLSGTAEVFSGKRHDTSVLSTHVVTSQAACLTKCVGHSECEAVNVEESGAARSCELLATAETSASALTDDDDWMYMCTYNFSLMLHC